MAIKAALLDERGIYLRMDELEDESQLTERHVRSITSCDLPAGRYVWIPDERKKPDGAPLNEYGGAFWDLAWLRRIAATRDAAADKKGPASRNAEHGLLVDFLRQRRL